jgi:non-heme chloroperoxidase
MPYVTVGKENGANTDIYYKDWGKGQPIVFSHGWPLSADDWDTQMLFFLKHGYRVIAHDRRGHGRSTQTSDGHDMDHYADDLAALTAHLDLKDAIHVGHSTGGGEVAHYLGRHGESRVAKAALISAVPPLMVKTEKNPGGLPKEVFDGLQAQLAANRSQFYRDLPEGAILWLQSSGRESFGADHPELVASGYDGRSKGALRWDRRVLADRLHGRSEEDLRASSGHP